MSIVLSVTDLDVWKSLCPYGQWTCKNGREVLFNRQYWPILERMPNEPANSGEWVKDIVAAVNFFDDAQSLVIVRRIASRRVRSRATDILLMDRNMGTPHDG